MNVDHVLGAAKQLVLDLDAAGWRPPRPRADVPVLGEAGLAAVSVGTWNMLEGGQISEHDKLVSDKLGHVLCGGAVSPGTRVDEQHLLDLEREAFVSLCGEELSQARMVHLLKTGKPLRN